MNGSSFAFLLVQKWSHILDGLNVIHSIGIDRLRLHKRPPRAVFVFTEGICALRRRSIQFLSTSICANMSGKSSERKIMKIDTGDICMESFPCQHRIKITYTRQNVCKCWTRGSRTFSDLFEELRSLIIQVTPSNCGCHVYVSVARNVLSPQNVESNRSAEGVSLLIWALSDPRFYKISPAYV
jgi:hypothetical protein